MFGYSAPRSKPITYTNPLHQVKGLTMKYSGRTSPSYLIRSAHSFCFSMFVPKDLHDVVGKKELRYSLQTGSIKHRWGHGPGQWFTKFRKRCDIEAERQKMTFHSLRQTCINYLQENGAHRQYVKEFFGHKGRGDITWDLYGKQFEPQVLLDEVVSKITYPLDLSHLKDSKWVVK